MTSATKSKCPFYVWGTGIPQETKHPQRDRSPPKHSVYVFTHGIEEVRAGGSAVLGDLEFTLLLRGERNGRKHKGWPGGREKQEYSVLSFIVRVSWMLCSGSVAHIIDKCTHRPSPIKRLVLGGAGDKGL